MAEETMFDETNLDGASLENNAKSAELPPELQALVDGEPLAEQADGDSAALMLENGELKDQNLRLVADMENLRRRTLRDVADAKTYAVTGFARDMLSVLDNLARALDAIAPDVRETDSHLNALAEGSAMV